MSYGMFVYEDDAGNEWSVSVPTDVAAALSMVAATSQPYIDETIAPRWANFKNASGQTRQAVVQSLTVFAGIVGTTITIGGTTFTGTSARGETIAAIQPPLIQPPQALMGPPGPQGLSGLTVQTGDITGDTVVPAGSGLLLWYPATPNVGKYIGGANLTFGHGATPGGSIILFAQYGGGSPGQSAYYTTQGTAGIDTINLPLLFDGGGGGSYNIEVSNQSADPITVHGGPFAGIPGSNYWFAQYA